MKQKNRRVRRIIVRYKNQILTFYQTEEEKSKRNYLVNAFKAAGIDFKKTVPAQNPSAAEIIPTGSSSVPSTTNAEQKIDAGKAVQAAVVPVFKTQSKTGVLSDQAKHIASLFKKTDVAVSKVVPTVTPGQGAEERLSNTIIELSDDGTYSWLKMLSLITT